jgi:serine/threonine protein kinase
VEGDGRVVGGRYTLLRQLGSGGMAEVWLAADGRLGDKHVAVKRLLGFQSGRDHSIDVERARREALAASRLNHPNLVSVTDFVADDGEPFIVMEYVDGVTLDELIGGHGLPTARAARLIGQVAAALAEAHEAGIVHRDIKPANIMVTPRDVAKLADFGIARTVGDKRLTNTGFFTGTIAYLAPELLDGADATSASDVWSLGAVLFETIEGRPAFVGESTPSIIAAIAIKEVPRSTRSPQLAPIVERMLRRDPADRMRISEVTTELAKVANRSAPADATNQPTEHSRETVLTPLSAPAPPPLASPGGFPPLPALPPPPSRQRSGRTWWVASAVVVLVAAGTVVAIVATQGNGDNVEGNPPGSPSHSSSGAASTSPTGVGTTNGFQVLAHRGGRESYAEETLPSLVDAAEHGYAVETDVRWTSDGVAVLVHDPTTAANLECDGGPYRVADTTLAVLEAKCHTPAAASPNGKTYPPPTFDAVATALENVPGATLFAEVKVVQTPKQVTDFLAILNRYHLIDRAVVTSFKEDELAKMRAAAKPLGTTMRLMRFVGMTRIPASDLADADLTFVGVDVRAVTKEYLTSLRAAGLKTVAYTADSDEQWRVARAAGADYVLTDVPGAYLAWVAGG